MMRDGRRISDGMTGGGLLTAVAGNPPAEKIARKYRRGNTAALLVALSGLACSAPLMVYAIRHEDEPRPTAYNVATVGCMAILVTSGIISIRTAPLRYDAVNVFNDAQTTH